MSGYGPIRSFSSPVWDSGTGQFVDVLPVTKSSYAVAMSRRGAVRVPVSGHEEIRRTARVGKPVRRTEQVGPVRPTPTLPTHAVMTSYPAPWLVVHIGRDHSTSRCRPRQRPALRTRDDALAMISGIGTIGRRSRRPSSRRSRAARG